MRKINENNVRSRCYRHGYSLVKNKGYAGGYFVIDANRFIVFGSDIAPVDLDDISAWLDDN